MAEAPVKTASSDTLSSTPIARRSTPMSEALLNEKVSWRSICRARSLLIRSSGAVGQVLIVHAHTVVSWCIVRHHILGPTVSKKGMACLGWIRIWCRESMGGMRQCTSIMALVRSVAELQSLETDISSTVIQASNAVHKRRIASHTNMIKKENHVQISSTLSAQSGVMQCIIMRTPICFSQGRIAAMPGELENE